MNVISYIPRSFLKRQRTRTRFGDCLAPYSRSMQYRRWPEGGALRQGTALRSLRAEPGPPSSDGAARPARGCAPEL